MVNGKRLIVFSYDFPPSQGGIARLMWQIAKGLKPFYKGVTILTRSRSGEMIPEELLDVNIEYLPTKRGLCEWTAYRYLRNLKEKEKVTVICGLWHPEATITLLAGIPRVFSLAHGGELREKGSFIKRKLWLPFYGKRILNKCNAVIANSNYTSRLVLKVAPKAHVAAIPLAVDNTKFFPKEDARESNLENGVTQLKMITVSRIQPHKGHLYILEALQELPEKLQSRISWHIAGTGSFKEELQDIIQRSKNCCEITFKGFVSEESLNDFYNQGDVFVLCSQDHSESNNIEGFGLVFLEAQAAGTPVIGSNSGGIPDAIEVGKGGWIVSQDNKLELTRLLERLLENKCTLLEQGVLARNRAVSDCSWEDYIVSLNRIIDG